MEVPASEAREALEAVRTIEQRTRKSRNYRYSSPHLVLWGIIWIVGYTVDGLTSLPFKVIASIGLVAVGVSVGIKLPDRTGPTRRARILSWVAALAFFLSVVAVMQPTRPIQFEIFPALCAALLYAYFGIFRAPAYGYLSIILFALSMGGYLVLPSRLFPFWMAACGGGSLVISGLWLRRL